MRSRWPKNTDDRSATSHPTLRRRRLHENSPRVTESSTVWCVFSRFLNHAAPFRSCSRKNARISVLSLNPQAEVFALVLLLHGSSLRLDPCTYSNLVSHAHPGLFERPRMARSEAGGEWCSLHQTR